MKLRFLLSLVCLVTLALPAVAQNVVFDFESNVVDDGFFAPITQTVGDLELFINFGQALNRDNADLVNNTFVFNQTNSQLGAPFNVSISLNNPSNGEFLIPFRLISIDSANTQGLQLNRLRGIDAGLDVFAVDVPNTPAGGDIFITQSTDENDNPLGSHVIANIVLNYENGVDGEFQFPAIDNIVISTNLDPMNTPGDTDGDGDVDGDDFLTFQRDDPSQIPTWESNYPTPLAGSFSSVPEPTTLVGCLALLACGALARVRTQDR